eukprot:GGOE01005308.1.p1 GENE.GGOE01005308.1~~GGOE01005308.1.p1  ORF type:complete len:372 (-),score=41.59 GGOE01005308.1:1089-2054(-)
MKKGGTHNSYGFVQFLEASMALAAIQMMNGKPLEDTVLFVKSADHDKDTTFHPTLPNLEVTNLPDYYSEEDLRTLFGQFGLLNSAFLCPQSSKEVALLEFATIEGATAAKLILHGSRLPNHLKPLIVRFADHAPKQVRHNRRRKVVQVGNGTKHFMSHPTSVPQNANPMPQSVHSAPVPKTDDAPSHQCTFVNGLQSQYHNGRVEPLTDWGIGASRQAPCYSQPRRPPALDPSQDPFHVDITSQMSRASLNRFAVLCPRLLFSDDAPHSPASSVGDVHSDKSDRDDRIEKHMEEPTPEYQLFAGFSHVNQASRQRTPQNWW